MSQMKKLPLLAKFLLLVVFVATAHVFGGDHLPGRANSALDAKWLAFSSKHGVDRFGQDGYFGRAIRNGHALINSTYDYAWRFTRKTNASENNSCSSCHSPEELAYAFVSSDRFDPRFGKRVSFEESIMRCYVNQMDGFIPTIYDPAIRDIRIFSRMVAHDLKLVEGSLKE
jgi:cytochrome c